MGDRHLPGMQGHGGVAVTRTSKDQPAPVPGEPESPGGRAAERLREFEQARGLGDDQTPPNDDGREDEGHGESTATDHDRDTSTPTPPDADGNAAPALDDEVLPPDTDRHPVPPRGAAPDDRNSD
jgi:hypothetical protein